MEVIQEIRELEKSVLSDIKKSNEIVTIKKYMRGDHSDNIRMAAFHCLRRIFLDILQSGRIHNSTSVDTETAKKIKDYRIWLFKQLNDYKLYLNEWINNGNVKCQVGAVRTLIEFTSKEHLTKQHHMSAVEASSASFGVGTFTTLIGALLDSAELSAEALLVFRDEVLCKPDCAFYTLVIITAFLKKGKSLSGAAKDRLTGNALDILRMTTLHEEIDEQALLCSKHDTDDVEEEDEDDQSDASLDEDPEPIVGTKGKRKLAAKASSSAETKRKRPALMSRSEQIRDAGAHKRHFNRAWLALLSLDLNNAQHKLVLKHLPEHVIPHMLKPLLLADYLTNCYERGGTIAVLSLESLFHLIVAHNLDYPKYFESLYRLCSVEVFGAKHRSKFMKLLHTSLKSTNLAAYTVAAFCKRLSRLALHASSPSASFLVAQVIWLLRRHPQCQVLVHRLALGVSAPSASSQPESIDPYDPHEEKDLEKTRALDSSLWEALALQNHHVHGVAALAKSLQQEASTATGKDASMLVVDDFMNSNYAELIELDLKRVKKNAALAYKEPKHLLIENEISGSCFGI